MVRHRERVHFEPFHLEGSISAQIPATAQRVRLVGLCRGLDGGLDGGLDAGCAEVWTEVCMGGRCSGCVLPAGSTHIRYHQNGWLYAAKRSMASARSSATPRDLMPTMSSEHAYKSAMIEAPCAIGVSMSALPSSESERAT